MSQKNDSARIQNNGHDAKGAPIGFGRELNGYNINTVNDFILEADAEIAEKLEVLKNELEAERRKNASGGKAAQGSAAGGSELEAERRKCSSLNDRVVKLSADLENERRNSAALSEKLADAEKKLNLAGTALEAGKSKLKEMSADRVRDAQRIKELEAELASFKNGASGI